VMRTHPALLTVKTLLTFTRGEREENGAALPYLAWAAGPGWRMAASTVTGGGIGEARWVLNAHVPPSYARTDPAEHIAEIARAAGLTGPGVGMLTAADISRIEYGHDRHAEAAATIGLRLPIWAAAPEPADGRDLARGTGSPAEPGRKMGPALAYQAGTINIVAVVPVVLTDAALVNLVMTVTEAKTQALLKAGYRCTGTATDAVCIACRVDGPAEEFGGPRSLWGARLARAVHRAVHSGAVGSTPRRRSGNA
jgi:adenosylcobinamide amidohydrolase